eukprot:scpid83984/ scgid3049/ 
MCHDNRKSEFSVNSRIGSRSSSSSSSSSISPSNSISPSSRPRCSNSIIPSSSRLSNNSVMTTANQSSAPQEQHVVRVTVASHPLESPICLPELFRISMMSL